MQKREIRIAKKGQVRKMKELTPFRMLGRFEDGEEIFVGGLNEADCMRKLISIHDNRAHGELRFYTAVTDENYQDGYRKIG